MQMQLGDTLRTLRKDMGITQEALAEALDVSFQTVSKWERGECYPDITMLPGLSAFFHVTIDELLGMPALRKASHQPELYARAHALEMEGRAPEAAALLREALRQFPGNPGALAGELALALSFADPGSPAGAEALAEAVARAEQVLAGDAASEKVRATMRACLCFLYRRTGATDKADALARTLPHVWESREALLPAVLGGAEGAAQRKRSLRLCLAVLVLLTGPEDDAAWLRAIATGLQPLNDADLPALMERVRGLLAEVD